MSDVSSGARAPDATARADMPTGPLTDWAYPSTSTYPTASTYPAAYGGDEESKAKQVAGQTKEAAGQAAADVKDTAKEQAQRVGAEAKTQARNVAGDVRDRVSEQARTQNDKLVGSIREIADQLDQMRGDRADSPAATVVSRVAEGGRQMADYLDRNGPEGVLREVQDFARRRPGAFLATALAAGFVVGRLGKGVAKADPDAGAGKPRQRPVRSRARTPVTRPDPATTPDTPTRSSTRTRRSEAPATPRRPSTRPPAPERRSW